MKKKGFTLVELLAVIVILAVIALIAAPQVMKIINQSRTDAKEASLRSAFKVLETGIATGKYKVNVPVNLKDIEMDNNPFDNGEITYSSSSKDVYYAYEEKTGELVIGSKESLSAPEDTNPNRLANKLRKTLPSSNITKNGYITGEPDIKNFIKIPETDEQEPVKYRAVRIHPDGRVLVVRNEGSKSLHYDSRSKKEGDATVCDLPCSENFANATIKDYLNCTGSYENNNDCFLTQIANKDYITETIWDTRCSDAYGVLDKCDDGPRTTVAKVGLLTLYDVLEVGLKIKTSEGQSYLQNGDMFNNPWIGTGLNEGMAWNIGLSTPYGDLYFTEFEYKEAVNPAFTLKSNLTLDCEYKVNPSNNNECNGSQNYPFKIK